MKPFAIIIALVSSYLILGCTPQITTNKSSFFSAHNEHCFNIASKDELKQLPLNIQNLYQLTVATLQNNDFMIYYGGNETCKNFLKTDLEVEERRELVTSGGSSFSNTYGNINPSYNYYINSGSYYSKPIPMPTYNTYSGNTYTFTTPLTTSEVVSYYIKYKLEIAVLEENEYHPVWEGIMQGRSSASNYESASSVGDEDIKVISLMANVMIKQNFDIQDTKINTTAETLSENKTTTNKFENVKEAALNQTTHTQNSNFIINPNNKKNPEITSNQPQEIKAEDTDIFKLSPKKK